MEIRKRKWAATSEMNTRYRNKDHVEGTTARLIQYYADKDKKTRKETHMCRYCFYFNTSRIGGSAITSVGCANCDIKMTFGNTCTDVFCDECADQLKMCKHCGAKMD